MKLIVPLTICLLIIASHTQAQNTFPATGRVGINILTPTTSLHVKGGARIGNPSSYMLIDSLTGSLTLTGNAGYLIGQNKFVFQDSAHKQSGLRYNTATSSYELTNFSAVPFIGLNATAGNAYFKGKVGVGTDTPFEKLTVIGNGLFNGATDSRVYINKAAANNTASILFNQGGLGNSNTWAEIGLTADNKLHFRSNPTIGTATDRMVINNVNGYVGVGTPSPTRNLDVRSPGVDTAGSFSIANKDNTHQLFFLSGRASDPKPYIGWTPTDVLRFAVLKSGVFTEYLRIDTLGRVGIGSTSPNAKLHVVGQVRVVDGTQAAGRVFTSDSLGFASWKPLPPGQWANSDSNIYNTNIGNVGIGTSTPHQKLEVSGDALIDSLTVGGGNNNAYNDNTAFGKKALAKNGGGGSNTAIGYYTLSNHVSPAGADNDNNTAVGWGALMADSSGNNNTALGNGTLLGNIKGASNTAVGSLALRDNTGNNNTATGAYAMLYNTKGIYNTANGYGGLYNNKTGSYNTANGAAALYNDTSGIGNTATGYGSQYYSTNGMYNTTYGFYSLLNNKTGSHNTAIGWAAGHLKAYGSYNTFLGDSTEASADSLTNATAVGAKAVVSASNSLVLGSNANVGIGVSAPAAKLDILGKIKIVDSTQFDGRVLTSDSFGVASWKDPGIYWSKNGNDIYKNNAGNVGIGTTIPAAALDVNGSFTTRGITRLTTTADNTGGNVGIGGPTYVDAKLAVTSNQFAGVYINDNVSGNYALYLNGEAAKPGGGSWTVASDGLLKNRIQSYREGLDQVMKINPVKFHYNAESGFNTESEYIGVVAQDVQKVAPYMVGKFKRQTDNKEFLSVDNSAMTYMLINAVKELKGKNDSKDSLIAQQSQQLGLQQKQINNQQQQLNVIMQKLADLQAAQLACCNATRLNTTNTDVTLNSNDAPSLKQNTPNPFGQSTIIKYHLPAKITRAEMVITDVNGSVLKTISLTKGGDGQVTITAGTLAQGSYFYSLLVDDKRYDTKQMMMIK